MTQNRPVPQGCDQKSRLRRCSSLHSEAMRPPRALQSSLSGQQRITRVLLRGVLLCLCFISPVFAADTKTPTWADLSPAQKEILSPLERDWNGMNAQRRKKWLQLAERYPQMTPEQQQRVHSRMREWVELTPEQRAQARERYKNMEKLPPEKRQDIKRKWHQYQEERTSQNPPPPPAAPNAAPQPAR